MIGNTIMVVTFVLIGPLPFVPLEPTVGLMRGIMVLSAFGYANVMVSTFARGHGAAMRNGFEKDIDTYLLISSMWSSSFYFGNFLGPTVAGIMVDRYGFRTSTLLYWSFYIAVAVVDVFELAYNVKKKRTKWNDEYQRIE